MSSFLSLILAVLLILVNQSASVESHRQSSSNADVKSTESKVACTDNSKPASALPPPGPQCEKDEFAKRGRPFMFPANAGVAFGVSSVPDKPSTLYLWADNQTEKAESLYVCCISTLFEHIDVYDAEGHRVLSKVDLAEQKANSEGKVMMQVCSCSGWVLVPPHTIEILEYADISDGYLLFPGRYTITERMPAGSNPKPEAKLAPSLDRPGLTISIP
jgi:hypothetical protein